MRQRWAIIVEEDANRSTGATRQQRFHGNSETKFETLHHERVCSRSSARGTTSQQGEWWLQNSFQHQAQGANPTEQRKQIKVHMEHQRQPSL